MAATQEYEPTYKLPYPLDKFQSIVDMNADDLVQPVSGRCGTANCEPGDRCHRCVILHGRTESMMVHSLEEPEEMPCFMVDESNPDLTWQFILTAQLADPVTAFIIQELSGESKDMTLELTDLSNEFKVIYSQRNHLSLAGEDESEVPRSLLFYKESRIVAPTSIRQQIMRGAHNAGHIAITKTYNAKRAVFWWPGLFSDVKKVVDRCQVCLMSR